MHKTIRWEEVETKHHKKVADHLHLKNYDYKINVDVNLGGKKDKVHFYVPEIDLHVKVVENDAGAEEEVKLYEKHGKQIIHLTPDELEHLDDYFVEQPKKKKAAPLI